MPFKSEAQRRYLYANEPKVAKEFAKKTPKNAKLPARTKKKSAFLEAYREGGQRLLRR
jgi:hypothetical protein